MDTSSNGNGFTQWILKQGSLGVILGVLILVGQNNTNARIDRIQADLKADIQEIKQEIKEGQRELIGYMKDHEGRIANIEGRLDERQQQPAT